MTDLHQVEQAAPLEARLHALEKAIGAIGYQVEAIARRSVAYDQGLIPVEEYASWIGRKPETVKDDLRRTGSSRAKRHPEFQRPWHGLWVTTPNQIRAWLDSCHSSRNFRPEVREAVASALRGRGMA